MQLFPNIETLKGCDDFFFHEAQGVAKGVAGRIESGVGIGGAERDAADARRARQRRAGAAA